MYQKNKEFIGSILDGYAEKKKKKEECLQAIQNIIGEEIERKDIPKDVYAVDEKGKQQELPF